MINPFFSIVIPTYNRANYLPKAIESIVGQTFSDWELIIVDDGSIDNTKEIIQSYKDSRIRYIYQENAERSAARNNGINHVSGDWICFLDSDDEYLPFHLDYLKKFIEENCIQTAMIVTGLRKNLEGLFSDKDFLNLKNPSIHEEIWTQFILPTQTCVSKSIMQANKFDVRFRLWEDTHLWLRIINDYSVYQIEQYTVIQNIHDEGTVIQGMKEIKIKEVKQYIEAIADLRDNYSTTFKDKLTAEQFAKYIDLKYRMYLYQARQNKQFWIAIQIWTKAKFNKPSLYLLSELPKIFFNQLNIGIHGK